MVRPVVGNVVGAGRVLRNGALGTRTGKSAAEYT
jgi:hypothetical protein